jgi:hypothetical protein
VAESTTYAHFRISSLGREVRKAEEHVKRQIADQEATVSGFLTVGSPIDRIGGTEKPTVRTALTVATRFPGANEIIHQAL